MTTCSSTRRNPSIAPGQKPEGDITSIAGGFAPIKAWGLCAAWKAHHEDFIDLFALRVWLAAQELAARRTAAKQAFDFSKSQKSTDDKYSFDELYDLVGGSGGAAACSRSIKKLAELGLIHWSESSVLFPTRLESLKPELRDALEPMLEEVTGFKRPVPVPRRILTLLAGGARRSTIATTIAVLVRCLFWKGGVISTAGSFKAAWAAEVFGLSLISIKRARQHLGPEGLGWIEPVEMPQWHLNQQGLRVNVDTEWSRLSTLEASVGEGSGEPLIPPLAENGMRLKLPYINKNLSSSKKKKTKNQNLQPSPEEEQQGPGGSAPKPPSGFFKKKKQPKAGLDRKRRQAKSWNVEVEDLHDIGRLLERFEEAQKFGLINPNAYTLERDRRNFVAAAEHAKAEHKKAIKLAAGRQKFVAAAEHIRARGSSDPARLFGWLIRNQQWDHITETDEDIAHESLKRHLYGDPRGRENGPETVQAQAIPKVLQLSEDAEFVRRVEQALRARGHRGSFLAVVQQARPEWNQERWNAANTELEEFELRKAMRV